MAMVRYPESVWKKPLPALNQAEICTRYWKQDIKKALLEEFGLQSFNTASGLEKR